MDQMTDFEKSILVVDDNLDNVDLLSATFAEVNIAVTTARSVAQTREILKSKKDFDLILSDISMPVETGFDLLAWLANSPDLGLREIPVLLITSELPEAINRIKGLSLGAVDYLIRPIPAEELILRVQHAIENVRRFKGLRAMLQDSESQANVGRLLAASSHEIRNLTGLVLVAANALASNFSADKASPIAITRKTIYALESSARLLAEISRNMASLLNERGAPLTALSLNKAVEETLQLTEMKTRQFKVSFRANDDAGELWVSGNLSLIKQILINFIFNACDALAEAFKEGTGKIEVRLTEGDSGFWQVRVCDDGIGLPEAGKRKSFEPFKTTKSIRGGTGLGLWLCSRLAESIGANLVLESDGPNKGACAVLSLPKATPPKPGSEIDITQYLK